MTESTPATALQNSGARRVLIVDDETLVGMGLRAHLQELGHTVIGQASTAEQAKQMFKDQQPDLVLMDIRLDQADGIELAAQLLGERRVPIIIVSAFSDNALIARAAIPEIYGYLVKPVNPRELAAQMEVAVKRFNDAQELRAKNESLTQTLESRKIIERAKGLLMKHLHLDESQAHKRLQTESQKRRLSVTEIARRVVEGDKLLGA